MPDLTRGRLGAVCCADEVSHWTLVRCQLTQGGDTERREETGVINLFRWWQWIISASGYECAVLPITRWFEVTFGYLIDKTHHPPQPLYLIFNQPLAQSKLHHQRSCYLLRQELKKCPSPSSLKFWSFQSSSLSLKSSSSLSELFSYIVGQSKPKVLRLVFEEMVLFLNIFAWSFLSQLVTSLAVDGESQLG